MENTTYEELYTKSYPFRCDYDAARTHKGKVEVAKRAVEALGLDEENTAGDWYFQTWVKIIK